MFLRALKRLLSRRLVLLDPRKEVLDRDLLLRLRNDAHAYYRLLHKVEEIK